MTNYETLELDLGNRSYNIQVGNGLIASAGERIAPYLKNDRVVVITDENVAPHYLAVLANSLSNAGISCDEIILPTGEQTKDFKTLEDFVNQLLNLKIERNTTLVALGGGVIGDLTGFTAAISLRGIDFIQIPTTLLAQVDSSVGGKTGINTRYGKNLVGAFYQPKLVLADIVSLETLPKREILAGYAEIAKYGLINDKHFFRWLEENGQDLCEGNQKLRQRAVLTSCQAKAGIVSKDEFEVDERILLNLGHTFGHALETETGYSNVLLHGEAVAIGIALAFDLSSHLGFCQAEEVERVRTHFRLVGLPTVPSDVLGIDWNTDALLMHMTNDKKVKEGHVRFVLAQRIGHAFVADDVTMCDVRQILNQAVGVSGRVYK